MDNKTVLEHVSLIEDEAYNFKPIESVAKITDSMSHCSDVVTMQIYVRGVASYLREIKETSSITLRIPWKKSRMRRNPRLTTTSQSPKTTYRLMGRRIRNEHTLRTD